MSLLDRMRDITLQIPHLTDAERAAKLEERNEIEEQLRNLERSFAKQVEHIRELEAMLRNDRDLLGDAKIDFALQRMQQGDFDEANKLFTELIDSASDVIERLARAEYARGRNCRCPTAMGRFQMALSTFRTAGAEFQARQQDGAAFLAGGRTRRGPANIPAAS